MTVPDLLDSEQDAWKLKSHMQQQGISRQSPDVKVPLEVWEQIFIYLYPSQLSRMSMVSKTLSSVIGSLVLWLHLFNISHDAHIGLRLLKGVPESKSYMLYMCATSLHLCERCFRLVPFEVENSAELPLPVLVPLRSRSTNGVRYVGEQINLTWTVRFCLDCRRSHFSEFEERLPRGPKPDIYYRISTSELKKKHPAKGFAPVLESRAYWTEAEVATHMREYFGGTVGVKASTVPVHEFDVRTDKRIEWYQLQD
ncbi:hypothetical protein BGZ83_006381 [Gryganskiella cystojenkinii]|nr:hypothetical protein BGZ83_006381 [Gryganskiella cystojenkinii]